MYDLRTRSIAIIEQHQDPSGAYVACPNFAPYQFCWLRDGTFIAYAMDRVGRHDSARRFYGWVQRVLAKMGRHVERLSTAGGGRMPAPELMLPTRYRLNGDVSDDGWPNFQLDGYGTWLWGLARHIEMTGETRLLAEFGDSIDLTVRYLKMCWHLPNYDCWEEFGDRRHPATLASLYGGLSAINHYLRRDDVAALAAEIRQYVLAHGVNQGRFVKSIGNPSVDASLLWLSVPFGLVAPEDERMAATVAEIERRLYHQGVHRYPEDTYYGGGEWLLLACWLGWYYCRVGRVEAAEQIRVWVESCANASGELPEQVLHHVNDPDFIEEWEKRWGKVATPLLWSHAMYLILREESAGSRVSGLAAADMDQGYVY